MIPHNFLETRKAFSNSEISEGDDDDDDQLRHAGYGNDCYIFVEIIALLIS